ncbi:hypothetical protein CDAR_538861 [Caerostris darwini]|uniref:Uncharacterized protein n=1 Tax=Caerostris darwini TaxID=1538125 RepID=A0AAV4T2B3_9ARAC|nr:hypothetical protein CDAR_538861 [Caerostris darwini]
MQTRGWRGHDQSGESVDSGAREAACQARRMCMEIRASDAFRAGSTRDHASRIMSAPSLRPMRLNKGALRMGRMPSRRHEQKKEKQNKCGESKSG